MVPGGNTKPLRTIRSLLSLHAMQQCQEIFQIQKIHELSVSDACFLPKAPPFRHFILTPKNILSLLHDFEALRVPRRQDQKAADLYKRASQEKITQSARCFDPQARDHRSIGLSGGILERNVSLSSVATLLSFPADSLKSICALQVSPVELRNAS